MTGEGSADPTALVVRFNDCINGRDIEGLARLMSDDHTFIDSEGGVVSGKRECLDAWRGFFESFPDYRNVFDSLTRGRASSRSSATRCVRNRASPDRPSGPPGSETARSPSGASTRTPLKSVSSWQYRTLSRTTGSRSVPSPRRPAAARQ
ncbi:nuclear transport factor 2 family protein [Streptomyces sp. NBC_01546]|uniref:nuclear transport factor 2 family protein n=1 Tax=Streptomyces sp. NBC_01546 TaxID=2975872 RepID=UPI00386A8150